MCFVYFLFICSDKLYFKQKEIDYSHENIILNFVINKYALIEEIINFQKFHPNQILIIANRK